MTTISQLGFDTTQLPALAKLLEAHQIDRAMPDLVPRNTAPTEILELARFAADEADTPELKAGIWLYSDDLHRSHEISQNISTPTGAFWHAIMHRREGDFWNSKYWWRRVGDHLALAGDPFEFVDLAEADGGVNRVELVERQRVEWLGLFGWCLGNQ